MCFFFLIQIGEYVHNGSAHCSFQTGLDFKFKLFFALLFGLPILVSKAANNKKCQFVKALSFSE